MRKATKFFAKEVKTESRFFEPGVLPEIGAFSVAPLEIPDARAGITEEFKAKMKAHGAVPGREYRVSQNMTDSILIKDSGDSGYNINNQAQSVKKRKGSRKMPGAV